MDNCLPLTDLPVIPDLETVEEEDLTTQVAAPPMLVDTGCVLWNPLILKSGHLTNQDTSPIRTLH